MAKSAMLVIGGAVLLGLLRIEDAAACSCMGPHEQIVGPDRVDDAPLNAKVRLEVPLHGSSVSVPTLREPGGAQVDTTSRAWNDGYLSFIELTPTKPLQTTTRYEIALLDPNAYPSATVLSTFKTGATADTTAPKLTAVGTAVAKGNAHAGGGDCSIQGPWIEIGPVQAEDPARPSAKLMFGIWMDDAAGNIDTSKPPTALTTAYHDMVNVGRRSLCDPHDIALPTTPFAFVAIAAIDEAGNASDARKFPKIDLRGIGAHP